MQNIFDKFPIPKKNRENFLAEFIQYYIELPGLGAMPKSDLNALIVFLFDKYSDKKYSDYELSRIFKTDEGKIRNFRSLGLARFDTRSDYELAGELLALLSKSRYEIHNSNSYEIRFLIVDFLIKKYFEKIVEENEGTITYSRNTHQAIISISNLIGVYEYLLKQKYSGKELEALLSSINDNLRLELLKASKLDKIPESEKSKTSIEILKNIINTGSSVLNIVDRAALIKGVINLF